MRGSALKFVGFAEGEGPQHVVQGAPPAERSSEPELRRAPLPGALPPRGRLCPVAVRRRSVEVEQAVVVVGAAVAPAGAALPPPGWGRAAQPGGPGGVLGPQLLDVGPEEAVRLRVARRGKGVLGFRGLGGARRTLVVDGRWIEGADGHSQVGMTCTDKEESLKTRPPVGPSGIPSSPFRQKDVYLSSPGLRARS